MNRACRDVNVLLRLVTVVLLGGLITPAQAAEYCCTCKGEAAGKTIDASSRAIAVGQCSLECSAFTNVTSGKCAAPPAAPTAAPPATPTAAPPAAAAPTGVVLAYKSGDCSGSPLRVTSSAAQLEKGIGSFQVESGAPASAWESAGYTGRHTEFVGPSICVAPGFEIQSIKLK
jgi:hypothetical protein